MPASHFGHIVVPMVLEKSTIALLQELFPMYLREVERQVEWDGPQLPAPRNYARRNAMDFEPGESIPKVVVIAPGLYAEPEITNDAKGDSYYKATWQLGVGVATANQDEQTAIDMSYMYAAAARGIMIHNQDLGREDVCYISWLDENYDDLEIDNQLGMFRSAVGIFGVEVETAVSRFHRPPLITEAEQVVEDVEKVITTINDELAVTTVP